MRTVVFDVDGTLVDSERHGHRVAFNDAFAEEGLPHYWSEGEYGELLRITGGFQRLHGYLASQGYDDAEPIARRLHRRKTELFSARCRDGLIPPRPGVRRLLDQLESSGVPIAVATTGTRAWVEPLLDRLFGVERFSALLTGTEVLELKPNPAVYNEVLTRLALQSGEAVAVEDSANGVQAARAAGIECLAVTNDYTRDQDFSGARLVVDSFEDPKLLALLGLH